eukprot:4497435-Pyramimonas_sp.AAC.1
MMFGLLNISPTKQLCYITDDNTNGLPCVYEPVVKDDLSAGQLWCAKLTQTSAKWGQGTDPTTDYDGG